MTEDQLKKYVTYLIEQGYVVELENDKFKISIIIKEFDIVLWCSLSRFFPYEIPKIFIDSDSGKILPIMPHLYTDDSICIFDKGKVVPNVNEPELLIVDTIKAAITVIEDGITKKNHHDYMNEFEEYWSTKGIIKAQMFVDELNEAKSLFWVFKEENIIIAESVSRLHEISDAIGGEKIKEKKIQIGLLVPLDGEKVDRIPKTDTDIIKIIENYTSYGAKYNSFMQKNIDKNILIIFNLVIPEGSMIAGWIHCGPGVPKGFRKGHVNLNAAFGLSKETGLAVSIENCHQNRLFSRGGDGSEIVWNKVGIIGCGSIGSYLANALAASGTEKYILVDNERLKYENVARHSCGYFWVDCYKADAIGFNLQKHNPNITYEAYNENAHGFLEDSTDKINECNIVFVAVASVALEHHINKLKLDNRITVPIVLLWVEPYAFGGHAVFIRKAQNLYNEIFDKYSMEYKFNIVKNGADYLKREAGCQSTYMPYSGFLLQQYVYQSLEYIMSNYWDKKGNYRLTWCGKLSDAIQMGVEISEEYEEIEDFALISKRID